MMSLKLKPQSPMPPFHHHYRHFLRRLSSSSTTTTTHHHRPKFQTLTLTEAMISFHSSPSTSSLNSLLFACLLSGHPRLAPSFFLHHPHLTPDLTTFNTLLKNYASLSFTSSFFSLLPLMLSRHRISPNLTTFSIAIAGFYVERNLPAVDSLLFLMKKHRLVAGISIYNTRIQSQCKLRRPLDALDLLHEMKANQMKLNCKAYAHLILDFYSVGDLATARKLFDEMRMKGIVPESACYFSLAHYLCKGGEFEAAAAVCRKSVGRNWVPRFGTMRMLVEGLAMEGRTEEAMGFVEEVRRRFPENAELWKEVEEGLPK